MSAVFYREFRAVLRSICGIVFVSGALFALGLFVVLNNFNEGYAGFEANLPALSVAFALLIPLICMDTYPAEEREGTGRFLQILPLSAGEVAMGKYLARLAVAAIPTAAMLLCPVVLDIFGEVNYLQAYGGILMFAVLEVLLISVSMMISAFCRRQLAAWIAVYAFFLLWYLAGILAPLFPTGAWFSLGGFLTLSVLAGVGIGFLFRRVLPGILTAVVLGAVPGVCFIWLRDRFSGALGRFLTAVSPYTQTNAFVLGLFDLRVLMSMLAVSAAAVFLMLKAGCRRAGGAV